jgi:putative transposase
MLVCGLYERCPAEWATFRTVNVLDDFSREILAVEVDTNLPAMRVIRVLDRIAARRGYPAKLRMDNGPEFVSVQLAGWAEHHAWN